MSVIGTIGQFLIDYQDTLGVIVLVAFALLLLILLIRLIIKNAKRKKAVEERDVIIEGLLKQLGKTDGVEPGAALAAASMALAKTADTEEVVATAAEDDDVTAAEDDDVTAAEDDEATAAEEAEVVAEAEVAEQPEDLMEVELQEQVAEQIHEELEMQFAEAAQQAPKQFVEPAPQETELTPEKAEPARAYTSRDAGVDKYGNVYTESMLMDQIG